MKGFNQLALCGFLTRDPELRYTPKGDAVCTFGLAVNGVPSVENDRAPDVLFIDVVVWHKQAESCSRFLTKGRVVLVGGRLSMRRWVNHQDQAKFHYEVVARDVEFMDHADGTPHGEGVPVLPVRDVKIHPHRT